MRRIAIIVPLLMSLGLGCGSQPQDDTAGSEIDAALTEHLEAFRNRTIYRTLTPEILEQIPDDALEMAILDYVNLKIGDDYEHAVEIVTALPRGFRALYSTWGVEAEVNNGGFNQYFWNSSGEFADEAVAGFRLFGAVEHASLMERAVEIYRRERPRLQQFMDENTLEAFSESYEDNPLNLLDDEFFQLGGDLSTLRIQFIRAHPDLFSGE